MHFLKLAFAFLLAIGSWYFAIGTQEGAFFSVSAIVLAVGIIIWKLDKIERLLEKQRSDSDEVKTKKE